MNSKLLLFFLLSGTLLFAAYYETLHIQVLDGNDRFLEGANVSIKYQLNSVKGFIETEPKLTDSSGYVNITIVNTEQFADNLDDAFTAIARYDNQMSQVSYEINGSRPNMITLKLNVYYLTVRVYDQNKSPLEAVVTVGPQSKVADSTGTALMRAAYGTKTVTARYKGFQRSTTLDVMGDAVREITIPIYGLNMQVMDDNGAPLQAQVTYGNETQQTDTLGYAKFTGIPEGLGFATVKYGRFSQDVPVALAVTQDYVAVFDKRSPVISDVNFTVTDSGIAKIGATILDPGQYASGFDSSTRIYLVYKVNKTEREIEMYSTAFGKYVAEIPSQKPGSVVVFTIFAIDKAGNRNSISGDYIVPGGQPSGGSTENQTGGSATGGTQLIPNIDLGTVLIAAVVLVIIGALYLYYMKSRGEA